ncbi:ALDH-like protein [Ramaria rubella]|nr:ALDH-like protein [Ramaria rubella]
MSITAAFTLKNNGLIKTQAFIDGKWVDANDGEVFKVTNTSTGEALGTALDLGCAETVNAIDAAERAFGTWSKTTAKKPSSMAKPPLMEGRGQLLGLVHPGDQFLTSYTRILTFWCGIVIRLKNFLGIHIRHQLRRGFELMEVNTLRGHPNDKFRHSKCCYRATSWGAVTPSNFPAAMVTCKLGPALAAGCSVVLKLSSSTPYSALVIAELACWAGVPDGVINVITTKEHVDEVGRELCEKKTVEKITFTGSSQVAKQFYKQSAETMKKVTLAGSGNAPFIVFNDADLDDALIGCIRAGFRNSGQTCNGASHVYIQSSVYDDFVARLVGRVSKFKVDGGLEEGTTHGPLAHSRAVDKVEAVVKDAIKRGASVLAGGKRLNRPGSFFELTTYPRMLYTSPKRTHHRSSRSSNLRPKMKSYGLLIGCLLTAR